MGRGEDWIGFLNIATLAFCMIHYLPTSKSRVKFLNAISMCLLCTALDHYWGHTMQIVRSYYRHIFPDLFLSPTMRWCAGGQSASV